MRTTRVLSAATALVAGILTVATVPTQAATTGTIYVPDDFAISYTGATGHYDVVEAGLRVWTDGTVGSANKVAEYVATNTPLAAVGSPSLEQTATSGTIAPGYQLMVDINEDGKFDGILIGETAYNGNWWLNNSAPAEFKAGAPSKTFAPNDGGGLGGAWNGTLAQWSTAFPSADVVAFGFSLGSGVLGDWTIHSITFANTKYTFAEHVTLTSKNDCKDGGWMTSTKPAFKNQGDCVSSFARG